MKKIYLSKPAVLCAAGNNIEELWKNAVCGNQAGIKRVKACNGKDFFVGKINDSNDFLNLKSTGRFDSRVIRIEEKCLCQIESQILQAVQKYGEKNIGVCIGSCDNGSELSLMGHESYLKSGLFFADYTLEMQSADYVATFVKEKYGLRGPALAFSTACSSSASAMIKAAQLIKSGICDAVIAGGVDVVSETVLLGFDSLAAISSEITNPFSKNRHGITLGEGAVFFLFSKDALDENEISLLGYGESADAYHVTSPDPEGSGAFAAMKRALENAGLDEAQIDYLNLHGTGTKFNDSMEAKAVEKVFGKNLPFASGTKPITGHTLGAAGAIEAAICYNAIFTGKNSECACLPVHKWDGEFDPDFPKMNFVSGKEKFNKGKGVEICMSNSFAFGGANSTLIIGIN